MSFTLNGTYRDIANNSIINPTQIYAKSGTDILPCDPGDLSCGAFPYPDAARAVSAPQKRWEINPRFDSMIGAKNTFTARLALHETGTSKNPGGGSNLTTQASSSTSSDNTIQISDTQLLSNRVINETRFEYEHGSDTSTPLNPGTIVFPVS